MATQGAAQLRRKKCVEDALRLASDTGVRRRGRRRVPARRGDYEHEETRPSDHRHVHAEAEKHDRIYDVVL